MANKLKYDPSFCNELVEWMGKGLSYITWGPFHKPRISVACMYEWEKDFPEWKEAKQTCYALALGYYEVLLRQKASGQKKDIDTRAVTFALATRFHKEYGEMQKIDHTSNGNTVNVKFVAPDGD